VIAAEAALSNERLKTFLHYLSGIAKSLLYAYHFASTHRVIRINEPVLLLDFHPGFVVDFIYHDLEVVVLPLFDHVEELGGFDIYALRDRLARWDNRSKLRSHDFIVVLLFCHFLLCGLTLFGQELFGTDLYIIGGSLLLLLVFWLQTKGLRDVLRVPNSLIGNMRVWLH
jgi:hypothetical protein